MQAYRSFLRAYAHVTRCLEGELVAKQKLTLPAFDVLEALSEAPGKRMRMAELAGVVLLSRSGMTRLIERLERLGLVRRERDDSDGRGVQAVLTESGERRLNMAAATHRNGVARYFLSAAEGELDSLMRTCQRLAARGE